MKLAVRRALLTDDREEMLALLGRNLPDPPNVGFDWQYTLNPAGQAWTWFLYQPGRNRAVAMASLFPRAMYVDGKLMVAGQVTHFVVDSSHRSLGPAVMLQRATFDAVNSGAIDFSYDCPPHDQGMSTFVRLGMRADCEVTRYSLPLRSDEYFEKRVGIVPWMKPVVATANLLLHIRSASREAPGVEIREFTSLFDEEFSVLDKLSSASGGVTQRRSAEDLNWRYRENPEHKYQILVARRGGELLAFTVFSMQSQRVAAVMDLFGHGLSEVGTPLLRAVAEKCGRQKLSAVYGYCSEHSQLKPIFKTSGFRARERVARVVAYAKPNGAVSELLAAGVRWSFGHAELSA